MDKKNGVLLDNPPKHKKLTRTQLEYINFKNKLLKENLPKLKVTKMNIRQKQFKKYRSLSKEKFSITKFYFIFVIENSFNTFHDDFFSNHQSLHYGWGVD